MTPSSKESIGKFAVHFGDEDAAKDNTIAELWKDGDSYYGTLIAPEGDYGMLVGKRTSEGIELHRFTGWQATRIDLKQEGTGWAGVFQAASLDNPRDFEMSAANDPKPIALASQQTAMKNPDAPFAFACTSLSGETVTNADERFSDKALVLDIMGTWCHNCMDESPVLEQIHKTFNKDGLEVVGLSFEISDDAKVGLKNLTLYRDRYKLT